MIIIVFVTIVVIIIIIVIVVATFVVFWNAQCSMTCQQAGRKTEEASS